MAPPTFSIPVEDVEVTLSNEVRGATLGRCGAKSWLSLSCAGPGLVTSWPKVPTPPGPESMEGKYEPEEERDLSFRGAGDLCRPGESCASSVRERSNEREGVSRSE